MEIDRWVSGCRVRGFDWIDGENYYLNIAYYSPGSSISQPPAQEKSFLIPLGERQKVHDNLHTVVNGLMWR